MKTVNMLDQPVYIGTMLVIMKGATHGIAELTKRELSVKRQIKHPTKTNLVNIRTNLINAHRLYGHETISAVPGQSSLRTRISFQRNRETSKMNL